MAFRIDSDKLNNKNLYNELIQEYGKSIQEALIISGNSDKLKDIPAQDILSQDSLLEIAIQYGDVEAVNKCIEAGVEIKTDNETVQKYLSMIFLQKGLDYKTIIMEGDKVIQEKSNSNKSTQQLIDIFSLIKEKSLHANPVWSDPENLKEIIFESAKELNYTSLMALLKLGFLNNARQIDQHGKTIIDYLYENGANSGLIEEIEKQQGPLSADDFVKKQYDKLLLSLKNDDPNGFNEQLKNYQKNGSELTQEKFDQLIKVANDLKGYDSFVYLINFAFTQKNDLQYNGEPVTPSAAFNFIVKELNLDMAELSFESNIKQFAHRIGLGGKLEGGVGQLDLEGEYCEHSTYTLKNAAKNYAEKNQEFEKYAEMVNFSHHVNMIAEFRPELAVKLRYGRYLEGKPQSIELTWPEHRVSSSIQYDRNNNKSYISFSNRGAEGLNPFITYHAHFSLGRDHERKGTIVYEMDEMINEDYFRKMRPKNLSNSFEDSEQISTILNNAFPMAEVAAVLPANSQSYGNCSYVNPKRTLEAALFVDEYISGKKTVQEAREEAYQKYKSFSIFDKQEAVEKLIKYYKEVLDEGVDFKIKYLERLMMTVIIAHHTQKNDEIELNSAKEIYKQLPKHLKEEIIKLVPEVLSEFTPARQSKPAERNKVNSREIKLVGDPFEILDQADNVKKLMTYLTENQISGKDISRISVEKGKIIINIDSQSNNRRMIRDELFARQLGADLKFNPNENKFEVLNFNDLHFDYHRSLKNN